MRKTIFIAVGLVVLTCVTIKNLNSRSNHPVIPNESSIKNSSKCVHENKADKKISVDESSYQNTMLEDKLQLLFFLQQF
jgi:hypothetical protein